WSLAAGVSCCCCERSRGRRELRGRGRQAAGASAYRIGGVRAVRSRSGPRERQSGLSGVGNRYRPSHVCRDSRGVLAPCRIRHHVALGLASLGTVLHFAATAKAAPIMLSIGRAPPDEEPVLRDKLDRFTRWHAVRAALQFLTFIFALWAVATR